MYLVESPATSPHYGVLRCHDHGFIKWLSETQYQELHPVMYPPYGITADDFLKEMQSK
jgi:hypothetical protein